jgi:hypothetical protein
VDRRLRSLFGPTHRRVAPGSPQSYLRMGQRPRSAGAEPTSFSPVGQLSRAWEGLGKVGPEKTQRNATLGGVSRAKSASVTRTYNRMKGDAKALGEPQNLHSSVRFRSAPLERRDA